MCVEAALSLGNAFRSRIRTLCPRRASSIATELPAHLAPTTIASYRRVHPPLRDGGAVKRLSGAEPQGSSNEQPIFGRRQDAGGPRDILALAGAGKVLECRLENASRLVGAPLLAEVAREVRCRTELPRERALPSGEVQRRYEASLDRGWRLASCGERGGLDAVHLGFLPALAPAGDALPGVLQDRYRLVRTLLLDEQLGTQGLEERNDDLGPGRAERAESRLDRVHTVSAPLAPVEPTLEHLRHRGHVRVVALLGDAVPAEDPFGRADRIAAQEIGHGTPRVRPCHRVRMVDLAHEVLDAPRKLGGATRPTDDPGGDRL